MHSSRAEKTKAPHGFFLQWTRAIVEEEKKKPSQVLYAASVSFQV